MDLSENEKTQLKRYAHPYVQRTDTTAKTWAPIVPQHGLAHVLTITFKRFNWQNLHSRLIPG